MLPGISQQLLAEAFVEDASVATPAAFRNVGIVETTHLITWNTGVSSGTVEIEAANRADTPTAEWAAIATVTFSGTAPKTDSVRVAGVYKTFRHRISTIVTDGTVTSRIVGSL